MAIKQPGKGVAGRKGGESANTIAADAAAQQPADLLAKTPAVNGAEEQWLAEAADAWEKSRAAEVEEELANQAGERVILLAEAGRDGVGTTLTDAGTGGAAEGGAAAGGAGGAGGAGAAFAATGGLWAPILGGAVLVGAAASGGGGGGDGHHCDPIDVVTLSDESADVVVRTLVTGEEGLYGYHVNVEAVESHDVAILTTSEGLVVEFCDEHPAHVHVLAGGEDSMAEIVGYSGDSLQAVGTIFDVVVDASGDWSGAYVDLNLDGKVLDDLVVTAEGFSADAGLALNYFGSSADVATLSGGDVVVTATGEYASAYAGIGGNLFARVSGGGEVTGTVGDVSVDAAGDYSNASLNLNLLGDITGSVDVTASGDGYGFDFYIDDYSSDYVDAYTTVADAAVLADNVGGDVTVTSDGDYAGAYLSLQVGENVGGGIAVTASGDGYAAAYSYYGEDWDEAYSRAYAYVGVGGNVSGDVVVEASGDGSSAGLNLYVGGDLGGSIDVIASGNWIDNQYSGAYADAYAWGSAYAAADVTVDGSIAGDLTVTASGEDSDAYLRVNDYASSDTPVVHLQGGDITVMATSDDAYAYADIGDSVTSEDIYSVTGTVGSIDVEASGNNSDAYLYLELSGDVTGGIDVSATEVYANAYAYADVTVDGKVFGDLTVDAGSADAEADATLRLNDYASSDATAVAVLQGSNITVTGGDEAYAYIGDHYFDGSQDVFSVTGTIASIDVAADGWDTDAVLYLDFSGDIAGGIDVSASYSGDSYAFAYACADVTVDGTLAGDLTVTADGYSYAYLHVNDVASSTDTAVVELKGGDITVTANGGSAYAYADIGDHYFDGSQDVFSVTGTVGSVDVEASGNNSDAYLYLELSGDVTGGIDVSASYADSSLDYSAYAYADVTVDGSISGDLTVTASGESSDAYLYVNTDASSEDTAVVDLQGDDITVSATGDDSSAYADVGEFYFDGSERVFSVTGTVGDVSVDAAGDYSTAYLNLNLGGDITGSVDVTASGDGYRFTFDEHYSGDIHTYEANADATVRADNVSGDVTLTAEGDYAGASLWLEVAENVGGGIAVTASGNGYASADTGYEWADVYSRAYANASVGGDVSGDVLVEASGNASGAGLNLYVGGDLGGSIDVIASGDRLANQYSGDYASSEDWRDAFAYADVTVDGSVSGDVTVTASGNYSDAYLSLDVGGDLNGSINVNASYADVSQDYGAYANADVTVDGDVSGDVTVTSTGLDADAYLSLDVGGDLNGNIDVVVNDMGDQAGAWVSAHSVGELWVQATTFDPEFVSISSDAYLTVDVAVSHDINGFDDGSVGDLAVFTGANDSAHVEFVDRFSNFVDLTLSAGDSTLTFGVDVDDEDASGQVWADAFTTQSVNAKAAQFLEDHFMQIEGFDGSNDLNSYGGEDQIFFREFVDSGWQGDVDLGGGYNYQYAFEDGGSYGSVSQFLASADVALDDYTEYFFGVVDGNGYLAVDADGNGISYVIEFLGYTDLTSWQVDGAQSGPAVDLP